MAVSFRLVGRVNKKIIEYQINLRLYIYFLNTMSYLTLAKLTNTSEEQDYYFLKPMFEKLPPNQIISQKYAPDVATQVKLMTGKDERRNNIHFIPPKAKNAQLETYAEQFNMFDYLGKQYADKINQIVYFKFNNTEYNLMPGAILKTRVMPAFFVPFQQIYSHHQTFFTKNIGLNFPQTAYNSTLSAIYNRGCSFDPIFCSNYQSANLFAAVRKNPFQYDLILQNDINSCESVAWFNFSVQFSQQGYYSFRIVNLTEDMLKIYEKGMKISYYYLNHIGNKLPKKNGQGWGFCGENIRFSKSSVDLQHKKGQQYYELYFQFKCKNKHDIIMFSFDVLYSFLEYQKYFNKIVFKKIKNMMKIDQNQFGRSISGSPLVSYKIWRKKVHGQSIQMTPQSIQTLLRGNDKRKSVNLTPINRAINLVDGLNKSIVVLGRIQGSNTNSSFIIQGMIDYLLDGIEFQSMKRSIDFYFIPLVNIDAAKYGNNLCNLTGSNLNSSWKSPHKQYQAQIYYLKEYLQEINKESPISLIINLASERQDIYSSVIGVKNDGEESEDSRIFPFILSRRNKLFSFEKSVFLRKNQNNSMSCVLSQLFSKALVYQLNVSHFQTLKKYDDNLAVTQYVENQLKQCNSQSYRAFGKDILLYYLEHVKIYDKNILLKDKWVKQIEQIQESMTKKSYVFVEDRKVQEKFPVSFYQIHHSQQFSLADEAKTSKTLLSAKYLHPKKRYEIDCLPRNIKRENIQKNYLPQSVNDFVSKRNQTQVYLKTKLQLRNQTKKSQPKQPILQKPISLARASEKKTSILLNCPSNNLNFQVDGQDKIEIKLSKKQKNPLQKQALKKELSTKLLRKVKIEDTYNIWKLKDKANNMNHRQFLHNS